MTDVARPAASALGSYVDGLPHDGIFSVWCGPLSGAPWVSHRADEQHYAASTMKVALVIAAYREAEAGRVDLDMPIAVHNSFVSAVGETTFCVDQEDDSDPVPWRRLGTEVSLRWLCYRAIVRSSNLATNLVLDVVGVDAVNQTYAAAGANRSAVSRGIEDQRARAAGRQNVVTATDLALTLQALHGGAVTSASNAQEILAVLAAQQINDAIPSCLPAGTRVAHKSGWVDGISHDAGIIYPLDCDPFVFVMCTTSSLDEPTGLALIAAGAAAAWADRRVRR